MSLTSHIVVAVEQEALLLDDDLDDALEEAGDGVHRLEVGEDRAQDGRPPARRQVLDVHLVDAAVFRHAVQVRDQVLEHFVVDWWDFVEDASHGQQPRAMLRDTCNKHER